MLGAWIAKIISNCNEMEICRQLSPPSFFGLCPSLKVPKKKTYTHTSHTCLDYASILAQVPRTCKGNTHLHIKCSCSSLLHLCQSFKRGQKTHDTRQNSHDLRFRSFEFYHVIFSFRKIWLCIFWFVMPFVQTQVSDLEV